MKSFSKVHPELVPEWSDKNGDLTPDDVSYGSNQKVWWIGKCGHVWRASVKNRSNGSSCPYCSGNQILYGVNDLESCRPEVAAEWSDRNYPMTPADVTIFANKKVWWKCDACGYEWQARIADRSEGHGCPVCAGAIVLAGHNDLATRYPELASEWSWENEKPASMYSPKSREKVWWDCNKCGRHWDAVINSRVNGSECPTCKMMRRKLERASLSSDRTPYMVSLIKSFAEDKGLKILINDDSEIGVPLAIYFPDEHTAIEFTDTKENRGPKRRWEDAKNWLCVNASIRLIRIVAPGAIGYKNCECVQRPNNGQMEAFYAVKEVMESI